MIGRVGTLAVAGAMVMGLPGAALAGSLGEHQAVLSREDEDGYMIVAVEDDDDVQSDALTGDNTGATGNSYSSGVDSNDHTGSGYSAVSRDRDYSRGDKTRDFTRDGGDRTRDRSAGHTNDNSRNDTR